jgi:hypothetical protein
MSVQHKHTQRQRLTWNGATVGSATAGPAVDNPAHTRFLQHSRRANRETHRILPSQALIGGCRPLLAINLLSPNVIRSGEDFPDEVALRCAVGLAVIGMPDCEDAFESGVVRGQCWVCAQCVPEGDLLVPARAVEDHEVKVGATPAAGDFDEESPPGSLVKVGTDVMPVMRAERCCDRTCIG